MSILTSPLPDFVEIDGKQYGIHTDFRRWILLEAEMLDGNIPIERKLFLIFSMYTKALPAHSKDAAKAALDFYLCKKAWKYLKDGRPQKQEKAQKAVYSFEEDAPYIYAAFYSQYGIDLQRENLHWFQFKALFSSLSEDCLFVKIMGYRSMDISRIKDKAQKSFYRRMQRIYKLPDKRTEEEKQRDMIGAFDGMF